MTLHDMLLIAVGPWLVVLSIALLAAPAAVLAPVAEAGRTIAALMRPPASPRPRPVTRPRPPRWAVA